MDIRCIMIGVSQQTADKLMEFVRYTNSIRIVANCEGSLEAETLLATQEVDLLFVDHIRMGADGVEFLENIRERDVTVLSSSFLRQVLEGYQGKSFFELESFLARAVWSKKGDAKPTISQETNDTEATAKTSPPPSNNYNPLNDYLFVKSGYKIFKINPQDIQYLKGMNEYVRINTTTEKRITTLQTLKRFQAILPSEQFLMPHRSYIVNIFKIKYIQGNRIYIEEDGQYTYKDEPYIPISKGRKDEFMGSLDRHGLL